MNMRHKNAQAAISLFVMCALFLAPVSVGQCETTEAPEQSCCCCPCCQDAKSPQQETEDDKDGCPCEMSEAEESEGSPALIFSNRSGGAQILFEATSTHEETNHYQSPFIAERFSSLSLPSRDHPLYILHSAFLI